MKILIIAEHDNEVISSNSFSALVAARKISSDIDILVAGYNCSKIANELQEYGGVKYVDSLEYEHFLPENLAPLVASIAADYSHIIAPSSSFGRDLMPRIAASLDIAQISDVIEIISPKIFKRPIYAGNAITTVEALEDKIALTIRSSAFKANSIVKQAGKIENIKALGDSGLSKFISEEKSTSKRPDLTTAKIVVSGGRAIGSRENFALIEQLADKLGAAIGASRAAVDAGFISNDHQVGQTGKIIAPDIYIAVGISGAIQHLAGMKDSRIIIAINKDENAPIFEIADYGIVGDLFEIIPQIIKEL